MNFLKKADIQILLIQILISSLLFLLFSGFNFEILYFENFSWFLKPSITNDIETYWISWEFFRGTDYLQFPFLLNPSYGEGLNVSIFHTDAIPLAAFLLRFFTDYLAENFQYFGAWSLMSFFLMSFFSYKLLRIFIDNKIVCFLSSIFFLIAPPFIDRVFLQQAISSHWLIIAAIYFYYTKEVRYANWNLLLVTSLLINGYLAMMVLAIFTGKMFLLYFNKNKGKLFARLFVSTSILIFTSYSAGLFSIGKGIKEGGFDIYGMSILSFINPSSPTGFYSLIFESLFSSSVLFVKEVEGFAFLGIGMIFILIILTVLLVQPKIRSNSKLFSNMKLHIPIISISIILLFYSLSNNIFLLGNVDFLGSQRIFSYDVPELLEPVVKVFRASGRFSWVFFYLVYFFLLVRTSEIVKSKSIVLILSLLLIVQIADSSNIIKIFRNELSSTSEFQSSLNNIRLKDEVWLKVVGKYKKINIYPLVNKPKDYTRMAFFASENGMSTNFGYFSRINHTTEEKLNRVMMRDFNTGDYPKNTLYVIQDDELWNSLLELNLNESDIFMDEVDGYKILIPYLDK